MLRFSVHGQKIPFCAEIVRRINGKILAFEVLLYLIYYPLKYLEILIYDLKNDY